MMKFKFVFTSILLSIFIITSACTEDNTQKKEIKFFPDVEEVAKEHAKSFSDLPSEGMKTQKKLFEVRAHEQDLRKAGLNDEADYYIEMFVKHLKNSNPSLADSISIK